MRFDDLSFGSLRIDSIAYEHDVVVDRGKIRKRKKKPSRKFRDQFSHTPRSIAEKVPWRCRRLVVGTGNHGTLPVMKEVRAEAQRRKVDLLVVPTADAIKVLLMNGARRLTRFWTSASSAPTRRSSIRMGLRASLLRVRVLRVAGFNPRRSGADDQKNPAGNGGLRCCHSTIRCASLVKSRFWT
jgi:hypothetical protein